MLILTWWLGLLIVGVGHWGWWLAALAAPKAVVVITGLLVAYGLGVGWGSVVPASAVVSGAIALVVAFDIFPPFWPDNIHYKYWAYTVLALWASSVALVCLMANVGQMLQHSQSTRRRWHLVMMVSLLLALWAGTSLYHHHWPGWVPWEHL
ncbi:hypothetical protein ACQ4N7_04840 [Nodosilinea sp. AN01ver1]|uniref:hypothetical protein n=1 Tax=Nodosilinea sp. AN01ver1 TaxID=3423362 RepID=UPI003D314547